MSTTVYTPEERNAIGKATYVSRFSAHYVTPWEQLPPYRRWFWMEAGLAAIETAERIDRNRDSTPRPRTIRVRTRNDRDDLKLA